MKFRNGFISNSSSCSFVIGKYFMSKEQVDKLRELVKLFDTANSILADEDNPITYNGFEITSDDETCINESDHYFYGQVSINGNHYEVMYKFLEDEKLRSKSVMTS